MTLPDLDAIPWSTLEHAYGDASDTPSLLRGLRSQDPAIWMHALDTLHGSLFHQGSVYTATLAAMPYLLALLRDPEVRCRGNILRTLGDTLPVDVDAILAGISDFLREHLAPRLRAEAVLRVQIADLLADHRELLLDLVDDEDPRIRIAAAWMVSTLASRTELTPQGSQALATALLGHVDEPHPWLAAGALLALVPFDGADAFLRKGLDHHADEVRFAAALACIDAQVDDPRVERALATALEDLATTNQWFRSDLPSIELRHHPRFKTMFTDRPGEAGVDVGQGESLSFPWFDGWNHMQILSRLEGRAPSAELLPSLFHLFTRNTTEAAGRLIRDIVGLAEGEVTPNTDATALTEPQLAWLRLLRNHAPLWATRHHIDLEAFGIRTSWQELSTLLGSSAIDTDEAQTMLDSMVMANRMPEWGAPSAVDDAERQELRVMVLRGIGCDAFMPLLGRFPHLDILELGPNTTDQGVLALPPLAHVRQLSLSPGLTDASMPRLIRFQGLQELHMGTSRISVEPLCQAGVLDGVQRLVLGRADPDLAVWALAKHAHRLQTLTTLWLSDGLTAASVDALTRLPALRSLTAQDASPELLALLSKALPHCQVS